MDACGNQIESSDYRILKSDSKATGNSCGLHLSAVRRRLCMAQRRPSPPQPGSCRRMVHLIRRMPIIFAVLSIAGTVAACGAVLTRVKIAVAGCVGRTSALHSAPHLSMIARPPCVRRKNRSPRPVIGPGTMRRRSLAVPARRDGTRR